MSHLIYPSLTNSDPILANLVTRENTRQQQQINLIASENLTSQAVLEATGSCLTNKYAEGYVGKRFYGGCQIIDEIEALAIERAKELFEASHVNVQPHSGASANLAVYFALTKAADHILGMSLPSGGHLTHGSTFNFSGSWLHSFSYNVCKNTHLIDYDQVLEIARICRPKIIIAGSSAYSRLIDFARMRSIADEVNALLWVDMAHFAGLVAAKLVPSPLPHAHVVTSTTHKTLRGPRGGIILTNEADIAHKINSAVFPGTQGGPLMHVIAAKAVSFLEAMQPKFITYQKQVLLNAQVMSEVLQQQFAAHIITHGTDTHLFLLDTYKSFQLTGKEAEELLSRAEIIVNKNTIPFDEKNAFVTSGIRIGTPHITSKGCLEADCKEIARHIGLILLNRDTKHIEMAREFVAKLSKKLMLQSNA